MKIFISLFVLTTTTAFAQTPRAYERPGYRELASTEEPVEKPRQEEKPSQEKQPAKVSDKKPTPSE